MLKKIKKIFSKIDLFLFNKFGSEKKLYFLENLNEAKIIFSQINKINSEDKIRFVGGCIRKALTHEDLDDIDLATKLTPDEVKKILEKNNIKVIDTGIEHGTVTAILNEKKFEITTLREDINTYGRHADVKFTLDWESDAARRDFTINSIYADINGKIYDPNGGLEDFEKGKVKFIGIPQDRIQEDYLRILRYLRFYTQYSKEEHDQTTIQAIKQNINGINKISNERVFDELKKILSLKNIEKLFFNKTTKEIILNIFPQIKYYERLNKINKIKKNRRFDIDFIIALLIIDKSTDYEYFCYKYKTSNKVKNRFKNIAENIENLKNKNFFLKTNIRKLIYLVGKNNVLDLLLFSVLLNNKIEFAAIEKLIDYVISYEIPKFPISGDDLKKYGYETGQILGKTLKALEDKWIENNFDIDSKSIEKLLKKN